MKTSTWNEVRSEIIEWPEMEWNDDFLRPTPEATATAMSLTYALGDSVPHRVGPNGKGGIMFAWSSGYLYDYMAIQPDGIIVHSLLDNQTLQRFDTYRFMVVVDVATAGA
jgi:hypothetical protein